MFLADIYIQPHKKVSCCEIRLLGWFDSSATQQTAPLQYIAATSNSKNTIFVQTSDFNWMEGQTS